MDEPIERAVGIDLELPAFDVNEKGQRTRRLIERIARGRFDLPVEFLVMDATRMGLADESFDMVMSRSAMEHVHPVTRALAEMVRVTHAGGIIYLGIDPFFWLRGCHKRGVVDIPWAHARLSLDEFANFVVMTEGQETSQKRRTRLDALNQLTVGEWRKVIESAGCEVLDWKAHHSDLGEAVLKEHPEVVDTLLPGISPADLLTERIEVWLRKQ